MTLKPFTKFCCDFDCFDRMIILLKVDKETKIRLQIGIDIQNTNRCCTKESILCV